MTHSLVYRLALVNPHGSPTSEAGLLCLLCLTFAQTSMNKMGRPSSEGVNHSNGSDKFQTIPLLLPQTTQATSVWQNLSSVPYAGGLYPFPTRTSVLANDILAQLDLKRGRQHTTDPENNSKLMQHLSLHPIRRLCVCVEDSGKKGAAWHVGVANIAPTLWWSCAGGVGGDGRTLCTVQGVSRLGASRRTDGQEVVPSMRERGAHVRDVEVAKKRMQGHDGGRGRALDSQHNGTAESQALPNLKQHVSTLTTTLTIPHSGTATSPIAKVREYRVPPSRAGTPDCGTLLSVGHGHGFGSGSSDPDPNPGKPGPACRGPMPECIMGDPWPCGQ
ncbi:hypothetical protein B0H13DRAFT_2294741 [Mycena leptocephala]|nr:hypothetical protein B0H13DRAFT_2294741 [Mycena leptocephala]